MLKRIFVFLFLVIIFCGAIFVERSSAGLPPPDASELISLQGRLLDDQGQPIPEQQVNFTVVFEGLNQLNGQSGDVVEWDFVSQDLSDGYFYIERSALESGHQRFNNLGNPNVRALVEAFYYNMVNSFRVDNVVGVPSGVSYGSFGPYNVTSVPYAFQAAKTASVVGPIVFSNLFPNPIVSITNATGPGPLGYAVTGLYGQSTELLNFSFGVYGLANSPFGAGVGGVNSVGVGVQGISATTTGVLGVSFNQLDNPLAYGVYGVVTNESTAGVGGVNTVGHGVWGTSGAAFPKAGVYGTNTHANGASVFGDGGKYAIYGRADDNDYAGYFKGGLGVRLSDGALDVRDDDFFVMPGGTPNIDLPDASTDLSSGFFRITRVKNILPEREYEQLIMDPNEIITYNGTTLYIQTADGADSGNGDLAVDADTLYVDSSENRVGIGTSEPSHKLTVNGNTKIIGNLRITGTLNAADCGDCGGGLGGAVSIPYDPPPELPTCIGCDGAAWRVIPDPADPVKSFLDDRPYFVADPTLQDFANDMDWRSYQNSFKIELLANMLLNPGQELSFTQDGKTYSVDPASSYGQSRAELDDLISGQIGSNISALQTSVADVVSQVENLELAEGIIGPQGPAGPTGATGATGSRGPRGYDGPQGLRGLPGATGPQGLRGLTGATGPQGLPGATGPQGLPGATGPKGDTGIAGIQGIPGIAGVDGVDGDRGPRGYTGVTGVSFTAMAYDVKSGKMFVKRSDLKDPVAINGSEDLASRTWATSIFITKTSSRRYKDNVSLLSDDFMLILQAEPKSFTWKKDGQEDIGYIAEEFDQLGLKNLVIYKDGQPDGLKYEKIPLYLIEVVKNQQKQIDELKADIEDLKQSK